MPCIGYLTNLGITRKHSNIHPERKGAVIKMKDNKSKIKTFLLPKLLLHYKICFQFNRFSKRQMNMLKLLNSFFLIRRGFCSALSFIRDIVTGNSVLKQQFKLLSFYMYSQTITCVFVLRFCRILF